MHTYTYIYNYIYIRAQYVIPMCMYIFKQFAESPIIYEYKTNAYNMHLRALMPQPSWYQKACNSHKCGINSKYIRYILQYALHTYINE